MRAHGTSVARHVRQDIYEVRAFYNTKAYRILFACEGRFHHILLALEGFQKKTQQTPWAFLAPPATKEKARFMNLGELIRWAARTRLFLDAPEFPPGVDLDQGACPAAGCGPCFVAGPGCFAAHRAWMVDV